MQKAPAGIPVMPGSSYQQASPTFKVPMAHQAEQEQSVLKESINALQKVYNQRNMILQAKGYQQVTKLSLTPNNVTEQSIWNNKMELILD